MAKSALTRNPDRFRFFAKFLLPVDEHWYANLFATRHPYAVKGDITPSYSILHPADVQRIKRINPAMKIVFIMRNPIYRDWSACRYNVSRHGHVADGTDYFERDDITVRSNYLRTIENYSAVFPDDQILYCFFDELENNPLSFYRRICGFLQIPAIETLLVTEKINKAPGKKFDPAVKSFLAARHLPQLEKLAERFGGYCVDWYADARKIVAEADVREKS